MSDVFKVDSLALEEATEDFITYMQAPPIEDVTEFLPKLPWWVPDLVLSLIVGLMLGLLAYNWTAPDKPVLQLPSVAAIPAVDNPPDAGHEAIAPIKATAEVTLETPSQQPGQAVKIRSTSNHTSKRAFKKHIAKGWLRYRDARYREASVAFGRAVHRAPGKAKGYYGLALSLFEQGFDRAALDLIESGLRKYGAKAELWLLGGTIYQWLGDEQNARRMYQRYLKTKPKSKFAKDVRRLLSLKRLPASFVE